MNDVHYLDTRCRNSVKNDIVRVRHDFAYARYSLALFVEVGMLCCVFQVVFYPLEKLCCGLLIAFADEVKNFQ